MSVFSRSLCLKFVILALFFDFGVSCSSPQPDLIIAGDLAERQVESAEAKTTATSKAKARAKARKRKKRRRPSSASKARSKSKSKTASKKRTRRRKKKTARKKKVVNVLDLPTVRKIRRSQAKRLNKIYYYKQQFLIGETDQGLLGVRPSARMPSSSQAKVKSLVKAENKDREKLYQIVAKKERFDKKQQQMLRMQFFESYRRWDPRGAYFAVDRAWQN